MIENDVLTRILYRHGYTEKVVYVIDGHDVPYWISTKEDNCEITIQRNDDATCNVNYTVHEEFDFSVTLHHKNVPIDGLDNSIVGLEQYCDETYRSYKTQDSHSNFDPTDKWV